MNAMKLLMLNGSAVKWMASMPFSRLMPMIRRTVFIYIVTSVMLMFSLTGAHSLLGKHEAVKVTSSHHTIRCFFFSAFISYLVICSSIIGSSIFALPVTAFFFTITFFFIFFS